MDLNSQNQSTWIFVRRCIGAVFLYLIYWLTIMGALKEIVGITLSPKQASELVETGIINSIEEYGWGEHYILYLIAFCVVSYCSAILAGATAKKKGAVIAGIANLPIIALYVFVCVYLYMSQPVTESPIAWKIVMPVSILGSIFFSVFGGLKGEQWQNSTFSSKTIFGIRPFHWWWLNFPLNCVIMVLIPSIADTLKFLLGGVLIKEAKYGIISFLLFVAFATFIYFVIWGWFKAFQLLSIEHKTDLSKFRIILNVLFYLWGIPLLFYVFCGLVFYFM